MHILPVTSGVASTVPQLQTPLIITHAATPDVTGKMCNDYVYRLSVNIVQNMRGAAEIAAHFQRDAQAGVPFCSLVQAERLPRLVLTALWISSAVERSREEVVQLW